MYASHDAYVKYIIRKSVQIPNTGYFPGRQDLHPDVHGSSPRALWFKARGAFRFRPCHKNDNPHMEEENNSTIRKFLGYDRHDTQEEVVLLHRPYKALHLLVNWCLPTLEHLHTVRAGSHITKAYDQAQAPEDFCPIPRGCYYIRGVYSEGRSTVYQDAGSDGCV